MGLFSKPVDLSELVIELNTNIQFLAQQGKPQIQATILQAIMSDAKILSALGTEFAYQLDLTAKSIQTYEQARLAYNGHSSEQMQQAQVGFDEYFNWQKAQTHDELVKLLGVAKRFDRTRALKKEFFSG